MMYTKGESNDMNGFTAALWFSALCVLSQFACWLLDYLL